MVKNIKRKIQNLNNEARLAELNDVTGGENKYNGWRLLEVCSFGTGADTEDMDSYDKLVLEYEKTEEKAWKKYFKNIEEYRPIKLWRFRPEVHKSEDGFLIYSRICLSDG